MSCVPLKKEFSMAREYTEKEKIYLSSTASMLEDALELMGNQIVVDLQDKIETMSEDETVTLLSGIRKNIYSLVAGYPEEFEQKYEEFKAQPEIQEMIESLTNDALGISNIEDNSDDEGGNNGNLQ